MHSYKPQKSDAARPSPLDRAAYQQYARKLWIEDDIERTEIHRLLRLAIEEELTETQKRYVMGYYMDGKNMPEIAREYGVNVSSVSRSIGLAKKKLKRAMKYSSKMLLKLSEKC